MDLGQRAASVKFLIRDRAGQFTGTFALVARGDSTSDIARGMFLSRRTVQTYISRILIKLGATSRVEIVREALRQGISPWRDGRPMHRRESIVI